MIVDLHIHSTASDGSLAPERIVELAAAAGLAGIALTDHDSMSGIDEALEAGRIHALRVVPGIELSASTPDGVQAHILGYHIDHTDERLTDTLEALRRDRLARASAIVEALADAGIDISLDDVLARAQHGSVGRAHIAMALVDTGAASSVKDAFQTYIGRDKPFFRPKQVGTPEEVIALVHSVGGIAVLAHPAVNGSETLIDALVDAGLDGIEVYHAQQDETMRERLLATARAHGLIVTGGSDFHGHPGASESIGDGGTPASVLADLDAAADARRR